MVLSAVMFANNQGSFRMTSHDFPFSYATSQNGEREQVRFFFFGLVFLIGTFIMSDTHSLNIYILFFYQFNKGMPLNPWSKVTTDTMGELCHLIQTVILKPAFRKPHRICLIEEENNVYGLHW